MCQMCDDDAKYGHTDDEAMTDMTPEEQEVLKLRDVFYKAGYGQNRLLWEVCLIGYAFAAKLRAKEAEDILRLLNTIKYLVGIAERGRGELIEDDDTAEQFVLCYVKQLEQKVASLKAQLAEAGKAIQHVRNYCAGESVGRWDERDWSMMARGRILDLTEPFAAPTYKKE